MITKKWHCNNCGNEFVAEVYEKGEAERKRENPSPLQCPKCNRADLREER
jgi:DNA-directed RNA polymerase subunit RPC12/RpoP